MIFKKKKFNRINYLSDCLELRAKIGQLFLEDKDFEYELVNKLLNSDYNKKTLEKRINTFIKNKFALTVENVNKYI